MVEDYVVRRGGKLRCMDCGRVIETAPLCSGDTHGICCQCLKKREEMIGVKIKPKWPITRR